MSHGDSKPHEFEGVKAEERIILPDSPEAVEEITVKAWKVKGQVYLDEYAARSQGATHWIDDDGTPYRKGTPQPSWIRKRRDQAKPVPLEYDGPWFYEDSFYKTTAILLEDLLETEALGDDFKFNPNELWPAYPEYLSELDSDYFTDELGVDYENSDLDDLIREFNAKLAEINTEPACWTCDHKHKPSDEHIAKVQKQLKEAKSNG